MAIWGVNIYQNDISLDVRNDAIKLFQKGKNADEITHELLAEWQCIMNEPNDAALFWFALSDTLWKRGIMTEFVKINTLNCIKMGADIKRWEAINPKFVAKRQKVIDSLSERILAPQPSPKMPHIVKLYKCEWRIGDVFAYRMESDYAKENGYFGNYLLIQKVDESIWAPGHIVPIVYVKITKDKTLPQTKDEYDALEYIQVWSYKQEQRFFPINGTDPIRDIEKKSKINFNVDEYGFLPVYRLCLINSSKRVIPKKLIYLGNYIGVKPPENEFIENDKINTGVVFWKKQDLTFESRMIDFYNKYNLRKLSIYHQE